MRVILRPDSGGVPVAEKLFAARSESRAPRAGARWGPGTYPGVVDSEPVFRGEPLLEILAFVQARLAGGAGAVAFWVIDPDRGRGRYAGESVDAGGERFVHRSWRVWGELAERLQLRLLTPRGDGALVRIAFERLGPVERWDADAPAGHASERYGRESRYARVSKLEDPGFVLDFADALARAAPGPAARILDLGVNTGDELALIHHRAPALRDTAHFVGVDHSASALAVARARFPDVHLIQGDLNHLADLALGAFDLVISLNTFQSAGIDDRELLRRIVQHHLTPTGAVILALPNSRYVDGELEYGARMRNFRQPELGLLVKDVAFYRKYLQQHHRQVFVTGKHYLLITGVCAPAA
jgi:SAM-dependent methyltransferase